MAYCDLADVSALIPRRTFGASTKPTTTQAEATVAAIALEIDGRLRRKGYTTPVTDATGVALLKRMNARGAAYEIEVSLQQGIVGNIEGPVIAYGKQYERDLRDLDGDKIDLGAVSPSSSSLPKGNTDLQAGGEDEDPTFAMDMKF